MKEYFDKPKEALDWFKQNMMEISDFNLAEPLGTQ